MPAVLVAKTAVTFCPYAPVRVAASSETAARIPAYSTTMPTSSARRPDPSTTHQIERRSASTSAGVAGRGFARAPGRCAASAATSASSPSGTPRSRRRSKPPSRASSSTRRGASSTPSARAKRRDRVRHDRLVEAQRRCEAERVHRAVGHAVAATERLRHARARGRAPARRAPCPHASRPRAAPSARRGRLPSSATRGSQRRDRARAERLRPRTVPA